MNGLNIDPAALAQLQQALNQAPATPAVPQGAIGQAQAQMAAAPTSTPPVAQPLAPNLAPPQVPSAPVGQSTAGGLSPLQQQVLAKVSALPPASQAKFKEAILQHMQQGLGK